MSGGAVLMVLSIHHVETLTHDCRWWGNWHHGNEEQCHRGFNLYCVATAFMAVSNLALVYLGSVATAAEHRAIFAKHFEYSGGDQGL